MKKQQDKNVRLNNVNVYQNHKREENIQMKQKEKCLNLKNGKKYKGNRKKLDLTDLKEYIEKQKIQEIPFSEYFSSDKYDAYSI